MKLLLWNVNGLRAISKKEVDKKTLFENFITGYDVVVLNETKIGESAMSSKKHLIPEVFQSYNSHSSIKKGYSGVSILTKKKPVRRIEPLFNDEEGRMVILEFDTFILVGVYVPNSGTINKETNKPKRHQFRTETWDIQFRDMCIRLEKQKPLIILGDLNVAYTDMDVYAPDRLHKAAGFTKEERENFGRLLSSTTLIDCWRRKHPYAIQYSFFDYRSKARSRNAGWRIDYALISKELYSSIQGCEILSNIVGSDHLPLEVIVNTKI